MPELEGRMLERSVGNRRTERSAGPGAKCRGVKQGSGARCCEWGGGTESRWRGGGKKCRDEAEEWELDAGCGEGWTVLPGEMSGREAGSWAAEPNAGTA